MLGAILLTSCSTSARRDALCQRAAGLESEFALVDQSMSNLAVATPAQIENSLRNVVASLASLVDLGPTELKDDFETINDTYDLLTLTLADVDYNGAIALSDSAVNTSLARFTQGEFLRAHKNVLEFVTARCESDLQPGINELDSPNTTLPNPVLATDNAPDLSTGFDNDDSVDAAYGDYVAQQYGLALTNDEALCLGRAMTSSAIKDLAQSEIAYTQLVNDALKECGVDAIVSD